VYNNNNVGNERKIWERICAAPAAAISLCNSN